MKQENYKNIIEALREVLINEEEIEMVGIHTGVKGCDFKIFYKRAPGLTCNFLKNKIRIALYMKNGKAVYEYLSKYENEIKTKLNGCEFLPCKGGNDYRISKYISDDNYELKNPKIVAEEIAKELILMKNTFRSYISDSFLRSL